MGHRARSHRVTARRGGKWWFAAAGLALLCLAYAWAAWWIVFAARIGPVVAVVDEARGMGVHQGDILGVASSIAAIAAGAGALGAAVQARR